MRCSSCGHENPTEARFCEGCGAGLVPAKRRCTSCGTVNSQDARFCIGCGATLPVVAAPSPLRAASPRPMAPAATQISPRGGLVCSACGSPNWPGARFCGVCGQALVAIPGTTPSRPSRSSGLMGMLAPVAVSVVTALVTAVVTRYAMSYAISLGLIP
jgi:predicted amidophosphoribosyltransferase